MWFSKCTFFRFFESKSVFDFFLKKTVKKCIFWPKRVGLRIFTKNWNRSLSHGSGAKWNNREMCFLAVFQVCNSAQSQRKIYNCERNLGSTACLISTKKLIMRFCLFLDFSKCITRPFCKQKLISTKTMTLICCFFFGMKTRGCFRDQLFAFDCTLEYVVSSIHISWWGFEFHDGRLYLSIHKGVKLR